MARSKVPNLDRKLLSLDGKEKVTALMAAKGITQKAVAKEGRQWPMYVSRALKGEGGHAPVRRALSRLLDIPREEIDLALDEAA